MNAYREIVVPGLMVTMLIDEVDLDLIYKYTWSLNGGYLHARVNCKIINLHILIAERANIIGNPDIDHKNRNKLDNRRCNLRPATRSQNISNSKVRSNCKFKGVSRFRNKWRARIMLNYKEEPLGYFDLEESAAIAYDMAAIKLFGEFANTNFPRENYVKNAANTGYEYTDQEAAA